MQRLVAGPHPELEVLVPVGLPEDDLQDALVDSAAVLMRVPWPVGERDMLLEYAETLMQKMAVNCLHRAVTNRLLLVNHHINAVITYFAIDVICVNAGALNLNGSHSLNLVPLVIDVDVRVEP